MSILGIDGVTNLASTIVNKIWPDKTQEEQAQIAYAVAVVQGQLATNQTEASNTNIFVAGWRPFIGWICGTGLGWNYAGRPLICAVMTIFGHPVDIPVMDLSELMPLLIGMLGLGGMRTYEKINGVNDGH